MPSLSEEPVVCWKCQRIFRDAEKVEHDQNGILKCPFCKENLNPKQYWLETLKTRLEKLDSGDEYLQEEIEMSENEVEKRILLLLTDTINHKDQEEFTDLEVETAEYLDEKKGFSGTS